LKSGFPFRLVGAVIDFKGPKYCAMRIESNREAVTLD
jgi:hypothetical protein